MAYQFADGFDNYTNITQIWDIVSGTITMSSGNARFAPPSGLTGQGISLTQNASLTKNLLSNQATLIIGVAYYTPNLPTSGNIANILALSDNSTVQVTLGYLSSGALQFYRGATSGGTGTAIGTSSAPGVIQAAVWNFFEVVVTIDPSAGAVALYMNQPATGATALINSTGLNTRSSSNSYANQVTLKDANLTANTRYDDLYCFDNSGGSFNARLGDQRIITMVPAGAGSSTQWTPSAGANWQCVDEIPPNDDTDYVSTTGVGNTDFYAMQSASISANPNFVVGRIRHRKDDASPHTLQLGVYRGGSSAFSPDVAVPSSYVFSDYLFPVDPSTSAAWTSTGINAAQFGEKLTL